MRDTEYMIENFRRNREAFDQSATFTDYIAATNGNERMIGGWAEFMFRTVKAHGFDGTPHRPLYLPEARTFADVVEDVRYLPSPQGGLYRHEAAALVDNRAFMMGSRAGIPFGLVGGKRTWSADWVKRNDRTRRHSGAVHYSTYARPTKAVGAAWETIIDRAGTICTLEFIKWECGRTLVVARHCDGIFQLWIALLDIGADITELMPADDRELIAREKQAEADAWNDETWHAARMAAGFDDMAA